MKRTLFFCMAAFLVGIYAAYLIPELISVLFLGTLAFFLLIISFFKRETVPYLAVILCFLFGAMYLQGVDRVEKRPLYDYMNEYVTVTGDVIEEVEIDDNGSAKFVAQISHLSFLRDEVDVKEKVRLWIPAGEKIPAFGERFSAVCLFSIPNSKGNSNGFDYRLYLKSKEIFFSGEVEPGTMTVVGRFPLSFTECLYDLNRNCGRAISQVLPEEAAAVLKAVALGDKSTMPDGLYEHLQVSGLSHMTAVSGMHVTTFLTAIYVLLSLLKRNKYKFLFPICGVVLLFMLFTGASPSVVRATIMSVLALVSYLFYRKEDSLTSLGFSAGIIALCNPFSVFDTGFILSFGATLGILLFAEPMMKRVLSLFRLQGKKGFGANLAIAVVTTLCVTLSVQLMLVPIVSMLNGDISLWCFVTNMLAAPVLPFLLVGGLLIGFLGLIHPWVALPVAWFTYPFIKLFLLVVHSFGKLAFGLMALGSFGLFGMYVYGLGLVSFHRLLHKKYLQTALISISCLLLLVCGLLVFIAFPRAQVSFINVGQGDSTLVKLPHNITMLVDGGGAAYETDYDVGKEVVLPYLQKEGVRKLDYVVATHPHQDHIGGLFAVLTEMPVKTLLVPIGFDQEQMGIELLQKAKEKGTQVVYLATGDEVILCDGAHIKVLMPSDEWLRQAENKNDLSLVFELCYGENTVLFMGDLEQAGEEWLIKTSPLEQITVLKAGHHGSAGATGEALLGQVKPQYAYIPCGKNSFGHPSKETLVRLAHSGTVVFRADKDLDVTFIFNKKEIQSIQTGGKTP